MTRLLANWPTGSDVGMCYRQSPASHEGSPVKRMSARTLLTPLGEDFQTGGKSIGRQLTSSMFALTGAAAILRSVVSKVAFSTSARAT